MERPDLKETSKARAWADAKVLSLNTVFGFLVTLALGAAGGQLGSQVGTLSGFWRVVAVTAGSVIGGLIGLGMFGGYQLLTASRNQRNELRDYLRDQDAKEKRVSEFKNACFKWAAEVETFVDARQAMEPLQEHFDLASAIGNKPQKREPPERTAERERIQRETISLYIERFRDDGARYFDFFISVGCIVSKGRPQVADPRTVYDLSRAADLMRTAADA